MKIAYVVSRFPAASETFVVRELNALVARGGFEVTLMSLFASVDDFLHPDAAPWAPGLHRPSPTQALGAAAWWLVRRPLRLLAAVGRVIGETRRHPRILGRNLVALALATAHARTVSVERIEHVHAHFASYPSLSAWLCGRLCDVPYSFTAHAHDIFVSDHLLAMKVAEARFVVTISEFNRRFLRDYGGDLRTPVEVVHCGVDPGAYRFRERRIPADGPIRALCVATLQEKKGHRYLLEALASTPKLARVELDLVGGGPLRDELEELARSLGLAERVRFHGPQDEARVRALLDRADLFVLPSIITPDGEMEGLPVALIEALACGVPAVSTRISGIPELIADGHTGALAEPADAAALAAALERLIANGLEMRAGRELVEAQFDVSASAARMATLFAGGGPRP